MNKLVTRHCEFECAHFLPGYDGGCKNLHGHTYKLEVTLMGPPSQSWGMVLDFKILDDILKTIVPDHKFIGTYGNPISNDIINILDKYGMEYVLYPFDTTAENMVEHFAHLVDSELKIRGYKNIKAFEVKLWETSNSYAEWRYVI